jgi:acyl-CoA thioester hydrolase
MEIDFISQTSLRVRYGETDQMGYVYYGNYAQYLEVGRVEAMRELGMSYKNLEELGYMLPVMNLNISYLQPAKYDDQLIVKTTIVSLIGVRLLFQYEITKDEKIVCKGETTLVFVNKETRRPIQPPNSFLERLKNRI